MTSKSIGFTECCCFSFLFFWGSASVLLPAGVWLSTPPPPLSPPPPACLLQRPTICTKCFTLPGVKILLFFQIFYKSMHPWKLDISYFILVCGCHWGTLVHMQVADRAPLIRLTTTNCWWKGRKWKKYRPISWELVPRTKLPDASINSKHSSTAHLWV